MTPSDPDKYDLARYGDDLLARLDELTVGVSVKAGQEHRDGWRYLLLACASEIRHLRGELRAIAERALANQERGRC